METIFVFAVIYKGYFDIEGITFYEFKKITYSIELKKAFHSLSLMFIDFQDIIELFPGDRGVNSNPSKLFDKFDELFNEFEASTEELDLSDVGVLKLIIEVCCTLLTAFK